nr:RVT_2 domain-containing protein [Tanacetum cinerariifolium]
MLNNRKSSSCKRGLVFDSSKASTSGTKPMSFVGSSAENETDGSTIKVYGSIIPGSMSRTVAKKVAEHVFSPPMSSRSDFVFTRKKLIHNRIDESKKPSLKPSLKSGVVDKDVGEEEAIRNNTKVVNNNNEEDESIEVEEIVNIKESKNHPPDQVIGNLNQRTLRSQAQDHSNFFCFISTIEPKDVNEALKDESWVIAIQNLCDDFAKIMHDDFEMNMMGELNFFLGLQIKQVEDAIFFNQSKYIKEMLKKFGLEDSKPTKTPMSMEIKLTKDDEVDSEDSSKYR